MQCNSIFQGQYFSFFILIEDENGSPLDYSLYGSVFVDLL